MMIYQAWNMSILKNCYSQETPWVVLQTTFATRKITNTEEKVQTETQVLLFNINLGK